MFRFPPRRILVGVEFSKASLPAWEAAMEIGGRFGADVEAVWCEEPDPAEISGLRPSRTSRSEGLGRLRARLGPRARLHRVVGEPGFVIPRLARDRRVDLIVMGTHHRPGLLRWVQGSAAEAVVHGAPCPVLLVPRPWRPPSWILAPVHAGSYARRGLHAAVAVARAYKGRVALLEVVRDSASGSFAAKRVSLEAERLSPAARAAARPELEVRVGAPVEEILRAGRERDLIVLVARRKSLLGDLVIGTTAERVLRHSRVPVLAIPAR